MDFEQSWGALEQHSIENASWGGVKNIDSPCTQLPFDVHSVDHSSYMPVAACSADTASLRRFRFQKKWQVFVGHLQVFVHNSSKSRPTRGNTDHSWRPLGQPWPYPQKCNDSRTSVASPAHRLFTVIYFFLLPAAVATSVADTITRVTMDFHPQLGNLQISTLFDGKKLYGKKKENSDERPVLSRNHFHVFFWHQRFGNKPIYCWESLCRICVVANPHETHQQKTIGPNPNHTKPEYNPN